MFQIIRFAKILSILLVYMFHLSCKQPDTSFIKDGNVYQFQGKDKVTVLFLSTLDINEQILADVGKSVAFILRTLPSEFKDEKFFIQGLSGEIFSDFMRIADSMYCIRSDFENKTMVYAYFSALYEQFMIYYRRYPFIPLVEFQKLFVNHAINKKMNSCLISHTVQYAIDDVYFVSILELLERPQRYFYPEKTKEELYRVLIYPEVLSFWNYMESRFGKALLLESARHKYTPEYFHVKFGEEISVLESSYVKYVESKNISDAAINEEILVSFKDLLHLYMSGTKKKLMTE